MKKILLPIIIIAIILILLFAVIATVNFGALTTNIIEKTANVDIKYQNIQGNILQGFKIEGYNIKLSETDSAYGEVAEIRYRFKPFVFKLPTLLQINLIEPTVCIKKKKSEQQETKFTLLRFNLGLRINLKNGKVMYENEKMYVIERISGLVLIDFVGDRIFVNTINLSFKAEQYPLTITSANLNIGISQQEIEAKSFKIKGKGIFLHGEGTYSMIDNQAVLKFKKADIDLEAIGLHKGRINFFGDVKYSDGNLLPKIRGTAEKLDPFDHFKFETASSHDTILVNIFDGKLFNGSIFAYIKIMDLKKIEFETNFKHINAGYVIKSDLPILINGYIGYKEEKFIGFLNSPAKDGLDIDSLFIFGKATKSQIILDSLFVKKGEKILEVNGEIYSKCDLNIIFNNFDIERFSKYFPLEGILNGKCSFQGSFNNPSGIVFTSNLTGSNFALTNTRVERFSVKSERFQFDDPSGYLKLRLENTSFKNFNLQNITLFIEDKKFLLESEEHADYSKITGDLEKIWRGEISLLDIKYNGVETKNLAPITFDILNKKLGEIHLAFIDGTLEGTLSPMKWNLNDGSLKKLGMLFSMKDSISGTLQFNIEKERFSTSIQEINFIGLKNGSLKAAGKFVNKGIKFETLAISDENKQDLNATGLLSLEESDINVKFTDVGVWALPFLNNFLRNPDGLLSGEGTIKGNLEDFSLNGEGKIKNGSFGVEVISAQFDSIASKVKFEGNRIIFESGKGVLSTKGNSQLSGGAKITAGGMVKLEPRFGVKDLIFDFSFKDAPIQFLPFAFGKGSGNFSLEMKDAISSYNGNITVKQGVVPINFGLKTEQETEEKDEKWTMNLKLKCERNIWLRNRDADIEFGGELYIIKKEHTPLYLSGTLETRRGNYYWLNHVLSITKGRITFIPGEKIDPELDIWAEMTTRDIKPNTTHPVVIELHCFGPLSEPIFEFFSDADYSEQDIITYLNLNITWQELESMKGGDYVGKILPQSILSWLEGDVSRRIRKFTGLDYFVIEVPFYETEEKTKVTVGKYISRNLFITFTYGITTFSNEFNVEYFIDDKNQILVRKDEENEYSLQYQHRIRF